MSEVPQHETKPLSITFASQYFFPEQFSNNAIIEGLIRRNHFVDVVTGVPDHGACSTR